MNTHQAHENTTIQTPAVNTLQASGEPNAEPKKRTRQSRGRHLPPDRPPVVIEKMLAGELAVEVEMFGSIASRISPNASLFMVMDAEDWPRVSARQEWWALVANGSGYCIASGKGKLAGLVDQADETRPLVLLSRFIMRAKTGQIVRTPPGNPLDLRKASLELVDGHAEWVESKAIQKLFKADLESKGY